MAAPLPLLQLNPRGDQGSVDSHPTGGEQWVPLPGLAWFPASLFWFPARGWWPAGLCVTQSVTPTIPSLAMCTQPHLLLLRKSHCTARAPAHLNECSVSWWVLGCWAAPALWAPATTGLSDTLSPTPSLPSVTLVAPTGLPHTQRRPRMWAFSGLGIQPVSTHRMPRRLREAEVAPRGSQAAWGGGCLWKDSGVQKMLRGEQGTACGPGDGGDRVETPEDGRQKEHCF